VVLGLITSKSGTLEKKDDVKRRIDEAAKFAPLDQYCLSPQCGFASTEEGNVLAEEEQWAKFRMIVELSKEVWGLSQSVCRHASPHHAGRILSAAGLADRPGKPCPSRCRRGYGRASSGALSPSSLNRRRTMRLCWRSAIRSAPASTIITDGEQRRESYSNRFATALDGVDIDNPGKTPNRTGGFAIVRAFVGRSGASIRSRCAMRSSCAPIPGARSR